MLRDSDSGTLGKGRAFSVAVAEGMSEGQEVDQMNPRVHAGCNHLVLVNTDGGGIGAVFGSMTCLAFAAHMLVPACLHHALSGVPASADRCIGINCSLGTFVRILPWIIALWTDEVVGDKVTETAEACEEQMIGLGLT